MKQNLYIFSDSLLRRKANTLFVETLIKENEDDEYFDDENKEEYLIGNEEVIPSGDKKYIPIENIDSITSIGSVRFNSRFMYFLSQNSIPLNIVNYRGNYSGSFIPAERPYSGSILLKQSSAYKNYDTRLSIAKEIIDASIHNMLANLKYHYNRGVSELSDFMEYITEYKKDLKTCDTIDEIRGIEGIVRKTYYETWRYIFNYPLNFYKRLKNPSPDIINALISYGNAIVYSLCLNQIYQSRLYPEIGFIHEPGDAKLSLVYDIADIYKPLITDRIIFKVINKNIISEKDGFVKNGICYIKKEAKKKYAQEFEIKMNTKFRMDGKNKKITYKRVVKEECYKIIAHLNEEKQYQAFKTKW